MQFLKFQEMTWNIVKIMFALFMILNNPVILGVNKVSCITYKFAFNLR